MLMTSMRSAAIVDRYRRLAQARWENIVFAVCVGCNPNYRLPSFVALFPRVIVGLERNDSHLPDFQADSDLCRL